jgi:two-component system NtrC family response regulator
VRELENRVKRAAVMADGPVVTAQDLDLEAPKPLHALTLREARKRAEKQAIELALAQANGNVSKAAGFLEISRPTLYDLIEEIGIALPRTQEAVKRDIERTIK